MGVLSGVMDAHRLDLSMASRAAGRCKGTLCPNTPQVEMRVTSEMAAQQTMVLRMMHETVVLGKVIDGLRCAHHAKGKVVDRVGGIPGGHGALDADAVPIKFIGILFMARGVSVQVEMTKMGEPEGRKGFGEGYREPITWPSLCRRHVLRRQRQAETRKSETPKPTMSMEGRVLVLEGRSMSEIERFNSDFVQTAATLEYDDEMVQDLVERLSWALKRIDALEAAVMARP